MTFRGWVSDAIFLSECHIYWFGGIHGDFDDDDVVQRKTNRGRKGFFCRFIMIFLMNSHTWPLWSHTTLGASSSQQLISSRNVAAQLGLEARQPAARQNPFQFWKTVKKSTKMQQFRHLGRVLTSVNGQGGLNSWARALTTSTKAEWFFSEVLFKIQWVFRFRCKIWFLA